MKPREISGSILKFTLAAAAVSYLFYDSVYAFLFFIPFTKQFILSQERKIHKERMHQLEGQFCEMIGSLSTYLSAGLSPENSFINSEKDMRKMYGSDSYIVKELSEISKGLKFNVPLTNSLKAFAGRVKSDDIRDFVTVFTEATKSGGNLNSIIKNTVNIMQEKKRIEDEIAAMLKGKVLEQKVICVIPVLIFLYLRFSSTEFISVLYHNISGIVVMTICLGLYIGSIVLSERIIDIRV